MKKNILNNSTTHITQQKFLHQLKKKLDYFKVSAD